MVPGFIGKGADGLPVIEIVQPAGTVVPLTEDQEVDVLSALGLARDAVVGPMQNAITSRVKTLIPLTHPGQLHALTTEMTMVEAVCRRIGSTGLYPYAASHLANREFEARQFPRSSGYPEDAATGIAASALAFGLLSRGEIEPDDRPIRIFQGRAMGKLSQIDVRIGFAGGRAIGGLLGGSVTPVDENPPLVS